MGKINGEKDIIITLHTNKISLVYKNLSYSKLSIHSTVIKFSTNNSFYNIST